MRLVVIALVVCALASLAQAQTTSMPINYTWTAPTTGSPVHHYVVQRMEAGGSWTTVGTTTTAAFTLTATVGVAVQIHVAGVDAQNRMGPYSDPSDSITPDPGPPGQPGKPTVVS